MGFFGELVHLGGFFAHLQGFVQKLRDLILQFHNALGRCAVKAPWRWAWILKGGEPLGFLGKLGEP